QTPGTTVTTTTGGGRAATAGAATAGAATAGAKAGTGSTSDVKIELITNGLSPFWDPMEKGMKDAAAKYNVSANWVGPPNSQLVEQKTELEEAAAQGVTGIGMSAIEGKSMTPEINNVVAKGIPVICFDSDAPQSKRLIYIGTDNFQSGQVIGQQLVKLLPNGGNVYGFVGNISAENARERRDGFLDAIKGHNIKLMGIMEDQKDQSLALQNVENVLQRYKGQIQALLGLYSYNLPKIAKAVKDANLRSSIKVVGFDAEPGTLDALDAGGVDATVVQKPYEFGYLSVEFLTLVHKDGADKAKQEWDALNPDFKMKKDIIYTGVQVVTPSNVKDLRNQLKKWGITQS
ncbi:MAG: sugar-binding protein, partial [Chloroflexi bacterium]|nr:sugar-binding protein [Chloroflexota bacterium]